MKLKPIPNNTVVHTPTEAEAKELLAILHENWYKWVDGTNITESRCTGEYLFLDKENEEVSIMPPRVAKTSAVPTLTLAEFKERYVIEEEKPQLKFSVGDLAMFPEMDRPLQIHSIVDGVAMSWWDDGNIRATAGLDYLKPYTKLETKPTEDMETIEKQKGEKGNNSENSQLNLCELLQGHEDEEFYSLVAGKCRLKEINEGAGYPICIILDACATWEYLTKDGKRFNVSDARCILFPSRSLYEQYPLDAYAAWMKWKEEQKKYSISISYEKIIGPVHGCGGKTISDLTEAQCDKCIEEIKAIIEKYSR